MALPSLTTKTELINRIISYITSRYPSADLSVGTVLRDLLVESPAELMLTEEALARLVSILTNFKDMSELLNNETYKEELAFYLNVTKPDIELIITQTLDAYATNFGLSRRQGNPASGVLTFYTIEMPTADITIPAGTRVSTASQSTPLYYTTTDTVVIQSGAVNYNPESNRFEVKVGAVAELAGSIYNVATGTITQIAPGQDIKGVSVVNDSAFVGGTDVETDQELLNRLSIAYTGNFQGTANSILAKALSTPYVKDASIVYLASDPNRIRSERSAVDIWVAGAYNPQTVTESKTIDPLDQSIVLTKQPTVSINYVKVDSNSTWTTLPNVLYSLVKDEVTDFRYSAKGFDKLQFTTVPSENLGVLTEYGIPLRVTLTLQDDTGTPLDFPGYTADDAAVDDQLRVNDQSAGTDGWKYTKGTDGVARIYKLFTPPNPVPSSFLVKFVPYNTNPVEVSYLYNSHIETLQDIFGEDKEIFVGQDILVREAKRVPITISCLVQVTGERPSTEVTGDIQTALSTLINTYELGAEINESSVIDAILTVDSVVDVRVPLDILDRDGGTDTGDILLGEFEYAVLDILTINLTTERVAS